MLQEGNTYYAFVLSKVDVEEGENKFYKLQLIESDKGKRYEATLNFLVLQS